MISHLLCVVLVGLLVSMAMLKKIGGLLSQNFPRLDLTFFPLAGIFQHNQLKMFSCSILKQFKGNQFQIV